MANHAVAIGVRLWLVRRRPAGAEALYHMAFLQDRQHDPNEFRCRLLSWLGGALQPEAMRSIPRFFLDGHA